MRLVRTETMPDGIFGKLLDDDGTQVAVTLENPAYEIKAGLYRCVRRLSPRFGCDVFMLTNVPHHDFIEIHIANWANQLRGCIGIGKAVAPSPEGQMITESKDTFEHFMSSMAGVDSFVLSVSEQV